ncbi:hypothetical protein H0H87_008719 [Tephrocybe sp. NHM501043]|nr:hypothetical protein H0H87_008719 [Tephrocybe sp. NHM501043]
MVALKAWALLSAFTLAARAGSTVWSGSFNSYSTSADFDLWSWSNQVGSYQWYIHGSGATSKYLALDSSYKNPAATSEQRGLKLTIDQTSNWNGQTMERTELIPQTTANLGTGNLFYHFSVKRGTTNPPNSAYEHQICFFESHFTELKYGVGSNPTNLVWMVGGVEKWSTPFSADTWFNFAYDIDFSAGTVGLWASTGGSALTKVVSNIAASTSTNSADWHLGVLRIITAADTEDWYFSGVYVESGPITTSIGSGTSTGTTSTTTSQTTTSTTTTTTTTTPAPTTTTTTTTSAPTSTGTGATAAHYAQCGDKERSTG